MYNFESPGLETPTEQIYIGKKYSKSVNGYQCLGQCITKNKKIIHPITLETVTDKDNSFCPVAGYETINEKTNKKEMRYTDKCYGIQVDNVSNTDQIMNVVIPYLDFDVKHFLIIFYNIHSYEEGITWITDNIGYPLGTRERIFECILNIYGIMIDIVDNRTHEFIMEIIKHKFIDEFYDRIRKYIYIDFNENTVKVKTNNQENTEENKKIKLEFAYKNYININEINKFFYKYLRDKKKSWENIKNHIDTIVNDFILYTIKSLNITTEIKTFVQK